MLTPGSGASAGGASGLIVLTLAPGKSLASASPSTWCRVAVTVAIAYWLAMWRSACDAVEVTASAGEVGERGGVGPQRGRVSTVRLLRRRDRLRHRGGTRRTHLHAGDADLDPRLGDGLHRGRRERRGRTRGGPQRGGGARRPRERSARREPGLPQVRRT